MGKCLKSISAKTSKNFKKQNKKQNKNKQTNKQKKKKKREKNVLAQIGLGLKWFFLFYCRRAFTQTSLLLYYCHSGVILVSLFLTLNIVHTIFMASIVNFEQVNISWDSIWPQTITNGCFCVTVKSLEITWFG